MNDQDTASPIDDPLATPTDDATTSIFQVASNVGGPSPKEAATNIAVAKSIDSDPDGVANTREALNRNPATSQPIDKVQTATPTVKDFASQSAQHAALVSPDVDTHSELDKFTHFVGDMFNGQNTSRQIADLTNKKMDGGDFTQADQDKLDQLNVTLMSYQKSSTDYKNNYSPWITRPVDFATSALGVGEGIAANPDLAIEGGAAMAGLFAAKGAIEAPGDLKIPVAAGGAIMGFGKGAWLGGALSLVKDTYDQSRAQIYNDLYYGAADPNDTKTVAQSDADRIAVAKGGAAVMAAAQGLAMGVSAVTVPWLAKYATSSGLIKSMASTANPTLLAVAKSLATSGIAGALGGGSAQAAKIVAEEMGGIRDGKEQSFVDALGRVGDRWSEISEAAKQGAINTAGTVGILHGIGAFGSSIYGESIPPSPLRDVGEGAGTPSGQPQLPGGPSNTGGLAPELGEPVVAKNWGVDLTKEASGYAKDVEDHDANQAKIAATNAERVKLPEVVENDGVTSGDTDLAPRPANRLTSPIDFVKGTEAFQRAAATSWLSQKGIETQLGKQAPVELGDLRKRSLEDAGIKTVFVDPDDYSELMTKSARARSKFDSEGIAASQQANAPVQMPFDQWLGIVDEHPEAAALTKFDPTDMSAKEYVTLIAAQQKKHELDMKNAGVLGPTNESDLTGDPSIDKMVENHQQTIANESDALGESQKALDAHKATANKTFIGDESVTKSYQAAVKDPRISDIGLKQIETALDTGNKESVEVNRQIKKLQKYNTPEDLENMPEATALPQKLADISTKTKEAIEQIREKYAPGFKSELPPVEAPRDLRLDKLSGNVARSKKVIADSQQRITDLKGYAADSRIRNTEIHGERDYMNQQTFTTPVAGALSEAEMNRFNAADRRARQHVVNAIKEDAKLESDQVIELQREFAMQAEREEAATKLEHDPNIAVVEGFLNNKMIGPLTPNQTKRKGKELPILSIDPSTMPDTYRGQFIDDAVLKHRKVFAKDGISLDHATEVLGIGLTNADGLPVKLTPRKLLEILASVPSREQAIEKAAQFRAGEIAHDATESVDLNHSAIARAYDNVTEMHLRKLTFMRTRDWPTLKRGIINIFKKPPTIKELQLKARTQVAQTPVKNLNINKWVAGERKSVGKAGRAFLDGDFETAYREQEAAAFASQMVKETRLAIAKVNKGTKYIVSMFTPDSQQVLKSADDGKPTGLYQSGVGDILDTYNFNLSKAFNQGLDHYRKLAEKWIEDGKGDEKLPDDAAAWMTDKVNAQELSTDQYLYLANVVRNLFRQAQWKNKLMMKWSAVGHEQSMQEIRGAIEVAAKSNPNYDPAKASRPQGDVPISKKFNQIKNSAAAGLRGLQFDTLELDGENHGDFFAQMIYQALRGTGIYRDSGLGQSATIKLYGEYVKKLEREINRYGRKKFENLMSKRVNVPEFRGIEGLSNGRVTKQTLFQLLLNMGNQGNREAIENFGTHADTVMQILKRELTIDDFDLAQVIWDMHKANIPRIRANEKRTTGKNLDFVSPVGFEAFGKQFTGGYYPIKYKRDANIQAMTEMNDKQLASQDGSKKVPFNPRNAFEGIVATPHTKPRTGKNWVLDLSPYVTAVGFAEVAHDLTMRVPVAQVMKILNDKENAKNMASILGLEKFNAMVNKVAETTNSVFVNSLNLYGEQHKLFASIFQYVNEVQTITNIAGSFVVAGKHAFSFAPAVQKMGGVSGTIHITRAVLRYTNPINWGRWGEFNSFARDLVPSLNARMQGVDDVLADSINKMMPKSRITTPGVKHIWNAKNRLQEGMSEVAIHSLLGGINSSLSSIVAEAAYTQFMSGGAPNFPPSRLVKMTDDEKYSQAQGYAEEIVSSTFMASSMIDRAAIQKFTAAKPFTLFWNIPRNILNTNLSTARSIGNDRKLARRALRDGNILKAAKYSKDAGSKALTAIIIASVVMNLLGSLEQSALPSNRTGVPDGPSAEEQLDNLPMTAMLGGVHLFNEMFTQNLPLAGALEYGINHANKKGFVSVDDSMTRAGATIGTGLVATGDLLYNWNDFANLDEMIDSLKGPHDEDLMHSAKFKAMLNTASYATGGLPIGAVTKLYNLVDRLSAEPTEEQPTIGLTDVAVLTGAALIDYIERHAGTAKAGAATHKPLEQMNQKELDEYINEEAAKQMAHPSEEKQAVKQAEDLHAQLEPGPQPAPIGAGLQQWLDIVAEAESRHGTNLTPDVGHAGGLRQFIPSTWNHIMQQHPEAALTEAGRTDMSKSGLGQQERAAHILAIDIVTRMKRQDIPLTLYNFYTQWLMKPSDAHDFSKASNTTKVDDVVEDQEIDANPDLLNHRTVGQAKAAIKHFIDHAFDRYSKRHPQAKKTTVALTNPRKK